MASESAVVRGVAQSGNADAPRLTARGLALGAEELPLLSGALHYFRVPRGEWGRCLDACVELGLEIVESYVPWAVHERPGGGCEFDARAPDGGVDRGLAAFLDACAARGLRVILRPGPHVNAELTFFGYPERVLRDERCLARGAAGNQVVLPAPPRAFPVPSYASERFLEQAAAWLASASSFIASRCWPAGPVVAAQVDNECCFFFRTAAYDQDYHPDAVAAYRRYLDARYPGGLPTGYRGARGASAVALAPPTRLDVDGLETPEDLAPHLDWLAFKEGLIVDALARLAGVMRASGLGALPLTANFPATDFGAGCGLADVERAVDVAGLDVYLRRQDYAQVKRAALALAGSSRLPYLPELGCGSFLWWFPLEPADQRATALAALMHGVRGFNLYMLVERDRWYGSPIGADGGRRRERFEAARRLIAAVKATRLFELERGARVGLLRVRLHERLALATSLLGPVSPMLLSLFGVGPEEVCADGGAAATRLARAIELALEVARVPFDIVEDGVADERLARYKLLLLPGVELAPRSLGERLARFVAGGGRLAIVGRAPARDETLAELAGELPPHALLAADPARSAPELAAALATPLAAELAAAGCVAGPDAGHAALELALHRERESGEPRVLFVANRGAAPATSGPALVELAAAHAARDALDGAPVDLARPLRLAGHEVRMLRLEQRAGGSGEATPRAERSDQGQRAGADGA